MERLTIRNSDGSVSQPTGSTVAAVFEKLAAYEDTGLEPAEIAELKEDLDFATAANTELYGIWRKVPHWISVEERLPELREIVLAYVDELGLIIRAKIIDTHDETGARRVDWARVDKDPFFLSCYTITHWMPLPETPAVAPPKNE